MHRFNCLLFATNFKDGKLVFANEKATELPWFFMKVMSNQYCSNQVSALKFSYHFCKRQKKKL